MPNKLVQHKSGYQLKGRLVYNTIHFLLDKDITFPSNLSTISIDCQQLTRIDSSGIALLIQWQRLCENNHQKLQFKNLPEQALSLIKANQLKPFFNLK